MTASSPTKQLKPQIRSKPPSSPSNATSAATNIRTTIGTTTKPRIQNQQQTESASWTTPTPSASTNMDSEPMYRDTDTSTNVDVPVMMASTTPSSSRQSRPLSSAPKRATNTTSPTPPSTSKPTVSTTHQKQPSTQPSSHHDADEHSYGYGADDFEDYEDDFETMDDHAHQHGQHEPVDVVPLPPGLSDIQRALQEENERASRQQSASNTAKQMTQSRTILSDVVASGINVTDTPTSDSRSTNQQQPLPNTMSLPQRQTMPLTPSHFHAQHQKQQIMTKRLQRAKQLSSLIDLDFVFYDIFDMTPLTEYDLYMRQWSRNGNVVHGVSTQCPDDDAVVTRDTQTDDWYMIDAWTQAPSDTIIECGTSYSSLPWLNGMNRSHGVARVTRDVKSGSSSMITESVLNEIESRMNKSGLTSSAGHDVTVDTDDRDASVQVDRGAGSSRFNYFLRQASQVMETLLEETMHDMDDGYVYGDDIAPFEISKGFFELGIPEFVQGQRVVHMCFSPGDYRSVLIAWDGIAYHSSSKSVPLHPKIQSSQGIMMAYRLNDPKTPYKILVCDPKITSCCFAPTKPFLVFASTFDGSVQVWDLREPSSEHINISYPTTTSRIQQPVSSSSSSALNDTTDGPKTASLTLRTPSYITDGVHVTKRVHEHPIVCMTPLHRYDPPMSIQDISSTSDTSSPPHDAQQHHQKSLWINTIPDTFHLATIDASGAFQLWVLIELTESAAVMDTEIGLRISSRVKLMPTNQFRILHPDRHAFTRDLEIYDCKFLRHDPDRFLVGTGLGFVCHESRFRDRCMPRVFQPYTPGMLSVTMDGGFRASVEAGGISGLCGNGDVVCRPDPVTAMDTCPHVPTVFLVGHASGTLVLYSLQSRNPLLIWPGGHHDELMHGGHRLSSNTSPNAGGLNGTVIHHSIQHIQWSPHRPAVFTVLDNIGNIYIWDLLQTESQPRTVISASVAATGDRRPSYFVMSPTVVSATSHASLMNLLATATRNATLVIGFDDGSVQVHGLDNDIAEMAVDEEKEFMEYLNKLLD